MVNDPIADLLTRIRNGLLRSKTEVNVPSSKLLVSLVKILKEEGYVADYRIDETSTLQNEIVITLKYDEHNKSVLHNLERVSKPGIRTYMGYREIPKVLNGIGISIFSTSQGLLTGEKARAANVGGEYLCKIW